jgi:hypothetical protein
VTTPAHLGHHVTDAEADAVLQYATTVMKTLGMAQWVVLIQQDPCDEDAYASVESVTGRYVAKVFLSDGWMDLSTDVRRNTITHEVLHLVHARIDAEIDDTQDLMHDHEFDAFKRRYKRETELMVDHFATFMADTHRLTEAWDVAHGISPEGITE